MALLQIFLFEHLCKLAAFDIPSCELFSSKYAQYFPPTDNGKYHSKIPNLDHISNITF